jgi:hypothetical protein
MQNTKRSVIPLYGANFLNNKKQQLVGSREVCQGNGDELD